MVFELVAQRLAELGFYNFLLPFILVAAILYGLLTKTKVLGESIIINGVVSLSVALIIFGVPVLIGISITKPLVSFFTSSVVFIILGVVGLLIAGVLFPGSEKLFEAFKGWGSWMLIAALVFAVFSGLVNVAFYPATLIKGPKLDILIIFGILIIALIILGILRG